MVDNDLEDEPDPEGFTDASPNPEGDADLAILCDALQERGATRAAFRYEDSGDSGAVEAAEYEPEGASVPAWLDDALRELAEGYCPGGYEDNEGGYGTLTVHPALGLASLEHWDRYEDAESMGVGPDPLPEELRHRLASLGVRHLSFNFDDYGDSGQFDPPEVEPEGVEVEAGLLDELEEFLADQLPGGWEINEGSFGRFAVDVESGEVAADAYGRNELSSEGETARWRWRQ